MSGYGMERNSYVARLSDKYGDFSMKKGKYYHYTSLSNCLNLLKHNENQVFELWASHLLYLNDKEEHRNGLRLIERKIEDVLIDRNDDLSDLVEEYMETRAIDDSFAEEVFVVCFCSERNLLSQWKYYGKNCGVAIQYNLDYCEFSGFTAGEKIIAVENKSMPIFPKKIIYDDLEKQKIVNEYIEKEICEVYKNENNDIEERKRDIKRAMGNLYELAPLFKHNSFVEEHESRLLFRPLYLDKHDAKKLIYYRSTGDKIMPYMKIKVQGKKEYENKRYPVIKSLTVGPGRNQDLVFEALIHFVKNKFYGEENSRILLSRKDYSYVRVNDIEIRKSSMPFRD